MSEALKNEDTANRAKSIWEWVIPAALCIASIPLFFLSTADYVPPGDVARMEVLWAGLDVDTFNIFPLTGNFARFFGKGNLLSPLCALVSTLCLYVLVRRFLAASISGDFTSGVRDGIARTGAAAAALAFMFSPSVFRSTVQIEPRLFDAAWCLVSFLPFIPYASRKSIAWAAMPVLSGMMAGTGAADNAFFILAIPVYEGVAWACSLKREGKGYDAAALFLLGFIIMFFSYSIFAVGDIGKYADFHETFFKRLTQLPHWYVIILFALIPFITTLFSARKAFSGRTEKIHRVYFALVTMVLILATCTNSLTPDAIMRPLNVPAVFSAIFTSFSAGCVLAYWWSLTRRSAESDAFDNEAKTVAKRIACIGYAAGGFFAFILAVSACVNRFVLFDAESGDGAFADRFCDRIIADLGGRTWFISDGSIDDNLILAANRANKELHIVNLRRENDIEYIDRLADTVKTCDLCPGHTDKFVETLLKYRGLERQRLVPFLREWFSSDKDVASKAVVLGAPDIWLFANTEPVPETLFFGGDPSRSADLDALKEFSAILHAPKGWGSWSLYGPAGSAIDSSLDRLRLSLRRHIGLIANNAGYTYQEKGLKLMSSGNEAEAMEMFDKAFAIYETVLNDIDADNFSAIINEMHLARSRHKKANTRLKDLTNRLNQIAKDPKRRYTPGGLTLLYGYICDPEFLARYGYALLKSGRPDDAMNQFRRAMDFIPEERRSLAELAIAASYWESRQDAEKTREAFHSTLKLDSTNKNALLGLARLAMLDNDPASAKAYLARLPQSFASDPEVMVQHALLKTFDNDLHGAKNLLRKITDATPSYLPAWSILATVVMRQIDEIGNPGNDVQKLAMKESLENELELDILPSMEKNAGAPDDYNVLATKAFSLIRKGGMDNLKSARDSLIAASRKRPDMPKTGEMILDIDIKMNDTDDARRQAVKDISANPKAPLANYVLGSLSLKEGKLDDAEAYLRVAVAGKRPPVLALNDLAETLRRKKNFEDAEVFARKAVEVAPSFYVAWDTLGSILMDSGDKFDEAESCIQKACDLSKDSSGKQRDVRMLVSLARIQIRRGENLRAKGTLRQVLGRLDELSDFEKAEFEELRKSAR